MKMDFWEKLIIPMVYLKHILNSYVKKNVRFLGLHALQFLLFLSSNHRSEPFLYLVACVVLQRAPFREFRRWRERENFVPCFDLKKRCS